MNFEDSKKLFSGKLTYKNDAKDEIGNTNYWAENAQINLYRAKLEISLSHPRTAPFLKLSKDEQKVQYLHHFQHILNDVPSLKDSSSFFETSPDGNMHLHASVLVESKRPFYIEGLIQETCKAYFRCLPKRYNTYRSSDYYAKWDRYKSPMICVQFTEILDYKRTQVWDQYIRKSQPIV